MSEYTPERTPGNMPMECQLAGITRRKNISKVLHPIVSNDMGPPYIIPALYRGELAV